MQPETKQAATHKGQRLGAIFVSVSLTVKPFALVLLHGKYTAKNRIMQPQTKQAATHKEQRLAAILNRA